MKHAIIETNRIWTAFAVLLVLAGGMVSGCRTKQAPNDQQIAADVQAKIKGESALSGQNIQVSAQNGVVTLNGTVSDDASRALAANDSGTVNGVRTVVNNLTVQSPQEADMARQQYGAPAPQTRDTSRDRREKKSRLNNSQLDSAQQEQPVPPPPPPPQVAQNPTPTPAPVPPRPATKTVTLPAGTILPVRMTETLDSATAQPNQAFHGALASDIGIQGVIAMPRGTAVQGRIVDVKEAAHFKGSALLSVQLTDVRPRGQRISVETDPFNKEGAARGKNTAVKTGGGALLGALIGGLAGGGKGALIGAAAGSGAGAGVNAVTRGQQAVIKTEDVVNFQLSSPITLTVPLNGSGNDGGDQVPDPQLQHRQP